MLCRQHSFSQMVSISAGACSLCFRSTQMQVTLVSRAMLLMLHLTTALNRRKMHKRLLPMRHARTFQNACVRSTPSRVMISERGLTVSPSCSHTSVRYGCNCMRKWLMLQLLRQMWMRCRCAPPRLLNTVHPVTCVHRSYIVVTTKYQGVTSALVLLMTNAVKKCCSTM